MNTHELTRELQTTVEQLQARVKELQAQAEMERKALMVALAYLPIGSQQYKRTQEALAALSSTNILNQVKAEALREAGSIIDRSWIRKDNYTPDEINELLRNMADDLLKGDSDGAERVGDLPGSSADGQQV